MNVAIGERYVWENPAINFGPIFMTVRRVIRGPRPRVIFDCVGPDGCPFRHPHRHLLPLPASMRREDWDDQDVRRVSADVPARRQCRPCTKTAKHPEDQPERDHF